MNVNLAVKEYDIEDDSEKEMVLHGVVVGQYTNSVLTKWMKKDAAQSNRVDG